MELRHILWSLGLSAALGVWLMAAPALLGVTGRRADSDYVAGALVITWAVIAFGEVARPARYLNVVMGCWIVAVPWMLSGRSYATPWHDVTVGVALIALSLRRGRIEEVQVPLRGPANAHQASAEWAPSNGTATTLCGDLGL